MTSVFEFLFKYRPVVFERGEFAFALPVWSFWLALALVALAVPLALQYHRGGASLSARDRRVLAGLRAGALAVLVFCLFQPALLISTVVPRRNYVALLLDDSRSMRVADEDGVERGARALEWFGDGAGPEGGARPEDGADPDDGANARGGTDPEGGAGPADGVASPASADGGPAATGERGRLRAALEERFRVRAYAFSDDARQVESTAALGFAGERTALGDALVRVRQEMAGLPLSGIVVVTDGADNADRPLGEALLELQASGVPVHAVGLGRERISPDVEVRRVEVPREVLEGTTLVADVILSHAGVSGRTVRLDVEDGGRILGTREVELGPDGETPVQLQLTMEEAGPRRLRVRAHPLEGEAVAENNARETLLEVRSARRKVLYFEGSPRPELKFLRRAVRADENLQLVVLLRTAEEKFLRLDVDTAEELAEGFPTTREELFAYAGLVLGDVEASFFTHDQLQMVADFVSQRGGGLLVLGGRRALSEGGYGGTPLAAALPVVLDPPPPEEPAVAEVRPALTPAGRRHPAIRVADDEASSAERWETLPPVTSVNRVERVKPGAVTLLRAEASGAGEERVMLAHQRFGRGTSIVLAVQDSWLWQMHADVPLEDRTHETLWRQLLRWLVHDAPERVRTGLPEGTVAPGEVVTVRAEVEDERFFRVNGASVTARVTAPSGEEVEVPLEWTVERDGEYEGRFSPSEPGLYRVEVVTGPDAGSPGGAGPEADAGAEGGGGDGPPPPPDGAAPTGPGEDDRTRRGAGHFRVGTPEREAFGAGRRTELLERIAGETGGRFYTGDDVDALPEEIRYTESGDTVREERPLWDMPILFLALGVLLSAEWGYRRWRDLA